MKTPNEIKDEVAKSHGCHNWEKLVENWLVNDTGTTFADLYELENEAMEAYAQQFREGEKVDVADSGCPICKSPYKKGQVWKYTCSNGTCGYTPKEHG